MGAFVVIRIHCAVFSMIPCIFLELSLLGFQYLNQKWISLSLRLALFVICSAHNALNCLALPIGLSAVHGFAGLLDRCQHGIVGERGVGGDVCGLGFKVHVKRLDTWVLLVDSQQ